MGRAALGLSARTRVRIRSNLEVAFPNLDPTQRDTMMRASARHFGFMLAEVAWLSRAAPEAVRTLCDIEGIEHLRSALEEGRGAMMITAHCGNWELLSARIPVAGIPLTAAVRRLDDPRLDQLVTTLRTRFGTEILPRSPTAGRQLARALTRNRVVGLLIDQDIRDVPGVFVPFFDRPAWTPSGAATLALRLRSPVIPAFIHRRPDGSHKAEFHPPLARPEADSLQTQIEELTATSTKCIEEQIRAHSAQWVWMHRRWRTRPDGE
jgi:KDO2-lipid IV(A) lauroyltransferase